jgi:prepilin-type N-terminal cleavage/methylation domain-containing protein
MPIINNFMKQRKLIQGFTLIELMVTIGIIAILSAVLFASYNSAREQARDKLRMSDLKEVQVALELYKAQHGRYPAAGCGNNNTQYAGPGPKPVAPFDPGNFESCDNYIAGEAGKSFTPDFIDVLPRDPKSENEVGKGYYYRTNTLGTAYKLMSFQAVETLTVDNYQNEFARCPKQGSACSGANPLNKTYSVYSAGAEGW